LTRSAASRSESERAVLFVGHCHAERAPQTFEKIWVQAGALGDLALCVAGCPAAQSALHRQQGQAAIAGGRAQLLQLVAVARQPPEQLEARLAGGTVEAVEQPLCLKVGAHARAAAAAALAYAE